MRKWLIPVALASLLTACVSSPPALVLAQPVDLAKFAGDWYVIGSMPSIWEKGAQGSKESYRLKPNGTMDTTFTFHANSLDGPVMTYHSIGYPKGPNNVVWGQHYFWPIDTVLPLEADYRIAYVSSDYTTTVIARESRDYVWIMARTPTIPEDEYQGLLNLVGRAGYDVALVKRVPQADAH